MAHRYVVVIACGLALGSIVPLALVLPKAFLPDNDLAELEVDVRARRGHEPHADAHPRRGGGHRRPHALPGVQYTLLTVGNDFKSTQNLANIYVRLSDPTERRMGQRELIDLARDPINKRYQGGLRLQVSPSLLIATSGSRGRRCSTR